ncbi:hypothetical protein THAPSDRAFT_262152, partial [Thalassiosira pseudonana CCMP1335]
PSREPTNEPIEQQNAIITPDPTPQPTKKSSEGSFYCVTSCPGDMVTQTEVLTSPPTKNPVTTAPVSSFPTSEPTVDP